MGGRIGIGLTSVAGLREHGSCPIHHQRTHGDIAGGLGSGSDRQGSSHQGDIARRLRQMIGAHRYMFLTAPTTLVNESLASPNSSVVLGS